MTSIPVSNAAPERRRTRSAPPVRALAERAYTSREASEVSGVPFFTIDYWGRTKFLVPTVARGAGRGKGRQRMYSYGDVVRLRIARELRDQKVSLETLRSIIHKLGPVSAELPGSRFVMIGREVETAHSFAELLSVLRRSGRRTFGVLLDLRSITEAVHDRARALAASQRPPARTGPARTGAARNGRAAVRRAAQPRA
jgi:DNA-binding transcriptional MerR regulator